LLNNEQKAEMLKYKSSLTIKGPASLLCQERDKRVRLGA